METLSRSSRVKRGFDRIAVAGGVVGAICALWWAVVWVTDARSDLSIKIGQEIYAARDDTTAKVQEALIAKFGMPASDPFDKFDSVDRRGPYGPAIADARFDKSGKVHASQDNAISVTLLSLSWVGVILLFSWLIRGFMA